ncbi:MAG: ribonuclease, partial [Micavibrio aeruginosavorus]
KGAAVTTYLSLPGRYCVLMPNSPRGGGVSRKIASFKERKRLKEMLDELSVPEGMSVILRTAGVTRTKVEIKRDLDYLTRLWNTIREHTLQSTAPALIYEEGSLIKRAIRDHYAGDIEDVVVSGGEGHKAAKEFMKMLMPSHAKKVQEYKNDRVPLFHKFGVENQIADMGEPTVNLKSGGYLVINPTEALVSVDVNSGRATKERHIEETALKTNLEAADEVARQLRLRDLGGLVVIDFIDMEDRRNNRKVENRLREALSSDRARIQVGRISSFGLLELSRQRMNPSLAESQQEVCAHCAGTGRVKTLDFSAISIVRALENEGIRGKGQDVLLTVPSSVALYILNNKRRLLADIERRYGFSVHFKTDDTMSTSQYKLETIARAAVKVPEGVSVSVISESDEEFMSDDAEGTDGKEDNGDDESGNRREGEEGERNGRRRGRRGGRGRGRGRDREDGSRHEGGEPSVSDDSESNADDSAEDKSNEEGGSEEQSGEERRGRRRRGGRGRGRGRERGDRAEGGDQSHGEDAADSASFAVQPSIEPAPRVEAASAPSNDDRPAAPPVSRDYEVVNQAPENKKKGWWNKLIE